VQPHQQQQQQQQQQSYACRICDVQCHSSANLHDHVHGTAHAKSEAAFLRGMHAALDYLSRSVSCAPAPPSAVSVGADSVAASNSYSSACATPVATFDVLTADGEVNHLYMTAVNPAVRALCDSLRAHEQGGAWRSFLAAVRAGMSEQQQWSNAFALRQRFHRLAAATAHAEQTEGDNDDDADYVEERFDDDDYYDDEEED